MYLRSLFTAVVVCGSVVVAWGQEAKPVPDATGPKITYDEHIRPIFREHCFACHALDRTKGGLTLDSYQKTMAGGSSGEIVFAGDTGSSRLWHLVSHAEEPKMPPMQDKLAVAKLDLIQKWIEQGALENAGSKANIKKKSSIALAPATIGKPEGPPAMPEGIIRQPVSLTTRAGQITALAASPWGPLVAIGGQKQVLLYHSETNELAGILPFPEGVPHVVRFSRNGSLLLVGGGRGGHSGCVVLFDVKTGKRVAKIGDELDAVLAADVSANHQFVAMSGPGKIIRIYAVGTGELLHEIKKHTDWVYSCEFSPDGVLLATSDRSAGLFVWESDTAREYLSLRGHTGGISDVAWRSDGNILASTGEDGTIRLWEMEDGKQVKQWAAHAGGGASVDFAHDGRIVSAGRDNSVKSWTVDGVAIKTYAGFTEQALCSVFTHDGKRVLGGDWLGNVKAWDAVEAKELVAYSANPASLEQQLAAADADMKAKQPLADAANKELADAQKLLADQTAIAKAAADKAVAAAAEPAKAEATVVEAKKAAEVLAAALKASQDQLTAAQEQLKAAADKPDEKPAKEQAVAAATEVVTKAQTAVTEQAKKIDALAVALKAAQDAVPTTAAEATLRETERKAAEAVVAAKAPAATAATEQLQQAQGRLQRLQADVVAFQQLPAKLQQSLTEAQQKAAPLKAAMDKVAAEQQQLAKAAADRANIAKDMAAKVEALKAELAKLEADKKAAEDAAAAKQAEVTKAAESLADLEAAVEKAAAEQKAFADAYGKK